MTNSSQTPSPVHEMMTAASLRSLHPRLHEWYAAPDLAANMRAHLAQAAQWIDDEEFGASYRDGVAVIDVPDPLAWANRRLPLADGGWCVTGIRFRNRDLAKPFVEVTAHDAGAASNDAHWRAVAEDLHDAYAPFAPRKLQVFTPSPGDAIATFTDLGWRAEVDTFVVAGLVRELRARPRTARFDDVVLTPVPADVAAAFSEQVHAHLAEENPRSPLWSTPQSLEEFTDYADAGLLFGLHVAGQLAGIVAAFRWNAHGMTGFTVAEIVIDAAHRGQRLAPAAMQHVLDRLPAGDDDVLWGTIHPDNQPSLRNALGVGREIVGANLWVSPSEWPSWSR